MNPVVHFEIPYKKSDRLMKFYKEIFGWQMTDTGREMGNYILATTSKTDKKGMLEKPGAINGGFFLRTPKTKLPSVVIQVPNLKESIKKITAGGGKIIGKPMDISGIGKYVSFEDSEGNRLSILESLDQ